MKHTTLKKLDLKKHPTLNEAWLQEVISSDPTILGLGDVVLIDRERIQSGAGRLDLLIQEADGHGRYEIEIQLGATDESHIIRTIEYWDIERRRYPNYDHTAIIIAEDITSRFLNVISLFNGFIPLMAFLSKYSELAQDPNGISNLRKLILSLAVHGKLVSQNPDDRTASGALDVALAEKVELVSRGELRQQKPLPPVSNDGSVFVIPESWLLVRLGNLANIFNGNSISKSDKEHIFSNVEHCCKSR